MGKKANIRDRLLIRTDSNVETEYNLVYWTNARILFKSKNMSILDRKT